ncbi:hypothetical protein TPA0906_01620 [Streptomyces olivaceus]|nr:hypothetical protein TPA0906_01620 [Streptomyces olivaceus]
MPSRCGTGPGDGAPCAPGAALEGAVRLPESGAGFAPLGRDGLSSGGHDGPVAAGPYAWGSELGGRPGVAEACSPGVRSGVRLM